MTNKVQAAVLTGPRRIEMREFALPVLGEDDGMIRVEACGVCASDIPVFQGDSVGYELPVVLGHEIVGTVERLGRRAAERWGVNEGDRIVVERWIPCGHCRHCYAGTYRLCVQTVGGHRLFYGGAPTTLDPALWGGYAEQLYLHPNAVVYKVSSAVPATQVPLFTPLANALSWLQQSGGVRVGTSVVIEGPGQEGLAATIVAKAAGAGPVIVTGMTTDGPRLALARRLGADATINVEEEDPAERVAILTEGIMADMVLDVTSSTSPAPIETAVAMAGAGGTIVLSALHRDQQMAFDSRSFAGKMLTMKGVWGRERSAVFAAIKMIESGVYPLAELTTHHFPLGSVEEALLTVAGEINPGAFHVSITPQQG
jgi:threonine dehydrogenase-like Zn-dependent dehydrogenase